MKLIKLFTCTAFILLFALTCSSQETYILFKENTLVGLKNQRGQVLIPAKYYSINDNDKADEKIIDYNGLLTAKETQKDGKIRVGIINTKDETILPLNYRYITSFSDDLAIAVTNKQLDIIDKNGKIINTIKHNTKEPVVRGFKYGIALLWGFYNSGKITVIDKDKIISTFKTKTNLAVNILSSEIIAIRDGYKGYNQYYSLYNISGKRLAEDMYNFVAPPNQHGLMKASKGWASAEVYGYLNKDGKEAIPFVYNSNLSNINENGVFSVGGSLYNLKNEIVKKANRDTTFYAIINSKYFIYSIKSSKLYGLINENYNIITPPLFIWKYLDFSNKDKISYHINKKVFEIDANGKVTPDNGALEYENAIINMPDAKNMAQRDYEWILPNLLLQAAVKKNYAPAQKILDSLYSDANYAKLHPQIKETYIGNMQKNALAGNPNSMYELGTAYLRGTNEYVADKEKGLKWLHAAADKNHLKAAYDLVFYYIGNLDEVNAKGVLNNYKGEKKWPLNELYLSGEIDKRLAIRHYSDKKNGDKEKMHLYFNKAINAGSLDAAYEYGNRLIASGNEAMGLQVLEKDAQKGGLHSQIALGDYYSVTAGNKARIDRKKSNDYYAVALRNSKISAFYKTDVAAKIDKNLGIDRSKITCTRCNGSGKITWDKPTEIYQNNSTRDKDGKLQSLLKKQTITLKTTDDCHVCMGTGFVKSKN